MHFYLNFNKVYFDTELLNLILTLHVILQKNIVYKKKNN